MASSSVSVMAPIVVMEWNMPSMLDGSSSTIWGIGSSCARPSRSAVSDVARPMKITSGRAVSIPAKSISPVSSSSSDDTTAVLNVEAAGNVATAVRPTRSVAS